nr:C4-dicarboxylate ABC transporter [Richelia sinica]
MIFVFNIFFCLSLTPLCSISSYCCLLRIGFDAIFGDLLLFKCLFTLNMSVFILN